MSGRSGTRTGPGMAQLHFESVRAEPVEAWTDSTKPKEILTPAAIMLKAEQGDAACERTMQIYENRLARSLAHVINILDPDVIVLGGGMSNIERLYKNVPAPWGNWVFSDRVDTRLMQHRFGDSSGVRGAAWL